MLLKPEIEKALGAAGLIDNGPDSSLTKKLDDAGLDIDTTLQELAILVRKAESEHLRHSAIQTILKLHGALRNDQAPSEVSTINIIIQSGEGPGIDLSFLKPPSFAPTEAPQIKKPS